MKYLLAALAVIILTGLSGYLFIGKNAASENLNVTGQPYEHGKYGELSFTKAKHSQGYAKTYEEYDYSDKEQRSEARLRAIRDMELKLEKNLQYINEKNREYVARKNRARAISEWLKK